MGSQKSGTVRLHRVLRTTPERLYRAVLDPGALIKWLPLQIPVELYCLGWQESLAQLANLVQPEIPGSAQGLRPWAHSRERDRALSNNRRPRLRSHGGLY